MSYLSVLLSPFFVMVLKHFTTQTTVRSGRAYLKQHAKSQRRLSFLWAQQLKHGQRAVSRGQLKGYEQKKCKKKYWSLGFFMASQHCSHLGNPIWGIWALSDFPSRKCDFEVHSSWNFPQSVTHFNDLESHNISKTIRKWIQRSNFLPLSLSRRLS